VTSQQQRWCSQTLKLLSFFLVQKYGQYSRRESALLLGNGSNLAQEKQFFKVYHQELPYDKVAFVFLTYLMQTKGRNHSK